MDLGIGGKKAIVCASSRGLGKGCAIALAEANVQVTINGRDVNALEKAAAEILGRTGAHVGIVVADVTTADGRSKLLRACPDPDILVNNAGGPPPGDFRNWDRETWMAAIDANMLTPIDLIRLTLDGMISRRFGRIINVTSAAVKAPIAILGLSNAARTGLTGFVAGLARESVKNNVTINNLLPGLFDTDRRAAIIDAAARASGRTADDERHHQADQTPAKRFGTIEEFGAACAFLCGAQAGFITGQNFLLDGGAFPGTL